MTNNRTIVDPNINIEVTTFMNGNLVVSMSHDDHDLYGTGVIENVSDKLTDKQGKLIATPYLYNKEWVNNIDWNPNHD